MVTLYVSISADIATTVKMEIMRIKMVYRIKFYFFIGSSSFFINYIADFLKIKQKLNKIISFIKISLILRYI